MTSQRQLRVLAVAVTVPEALTIPARLSATAPVLPVKRSRRRLGQHHRSGRGAGTSYRKRSRPDFAHRSADGRRHDIRQWFASSDRRDRWSHRCVAFIGKTQRASW